MKLNISYPATGCQKVFEVDDEQKIKHFYDKRMAQVSKIILFGVADAHYYAVVFIFLYRKSQPIISEMNGKVTSSVSLVVMTSKVSQ